MTTNNSPKKSNNKVKKILLTGIVLLLAFLLTLSVTHFIWLGSGSGDWKLKKDKNGIKIWTLKNPGSSLLKVKATMRVNCRLASAVFCVRGDSSTAGDFKSKDFKIIEKIETPSMYMAYYSTNFFMPPPLGVKEIIMLVHYSQDTITKKVEMDVLAAPNKIPPSKNRSRVKHLNNIWKFKPLSNGEIEWEITMDVDVGLPYFLFNVAMPENVYHDFNFMRDLVKTDKYKNVNLISIKEM